ncbi:MAG: peptidyl-tRNA hydrolase, partial [Candidatus Omnitrophica bacterium]|nr:peptidyl-tRNA hydrolase [Candidatus Omnitrophota bacterium]
VCDDINLDFGEMRLRMDGSDGGHNGLKSIIAELGCGDFPRLKMGVGAPPSRDLQAEYVLSSFKAQETKELPGLVDQAGTCCRLWLKGDVAQAMTEFNKRKDKKDNE